MATGCKKGLFLCTELCWVTGTSTILNWVSELCIIIEGSWA